ncbi:D-Ala-D-Ala carboxypeptidase family metallohydrolase [Flavobacterium rakeshii]|uniref:YcbK family protein n=1 Tax=Flavobacterium rakeshii TaxID=1038845 RepID=UPI002E7C2F12|nr:D-Ala-D-Ala carboxypeptidase family metallohydrolase [Flavobacterium rakeshii]MEE1898047.1 D-Ala-D-Ala carboxypeptidase family metallohydrolase [Flavobacterium rakeshii]
MKLTKNFSLEEFNCKDGTNVPEKYHPNVLKVAENLEVLREYLQHPIIISGSGYRTKKHNTEVGGAPKSQHLTASAADISVHGLSPMQIAEAIETLIEEGKMQQGGMGVYPTFVHYDIRGTKARW